MAKRGGYKPAKNYQPKQKPKRQAREGVASGDYRDRIGRGGRRDGAGQQGASGEQSARSGEQDPRGRQGASGHNAAHGRQDAPGHRGAENIRGGDAPARAARGGRDEAPRGDRARRAEARARQQARDARERRSADRDLAASERAAERRATASDRGAHQGEQHTQRTPGASRPRDGKREDVVLERLEGTAITAAEAEGVTFAELGVDERIVEALATLGAVNPFPIQVATIPDILGGRNVLGRGRTGSGKTIAFGAGLVQKLLTMRSSGKKAIGRAPKALILANTRELALQIDDTVQPLARAVGLYTTQLYGGVPYAKQQTALKRGVDIVIGTPGRIEDLARRGDLDLTQIAITVLDEADEMCDMGFLEPVQRILTQTRSNGQRLMFSATLDAAVRQLVEQFLPRPAVHEVAGEEARGDIEHRVLVVDRYDKEAVVAQLAGSGGKVLVFTRTRAGAEHYAEVLADYGVPAVALHGDLTQARRTRNLAELTRGRVNVLVATDVAARGIHIDDVRLVVQADPPDEYKTYLHRAGRTGRAGNRGTVVTVIAPSRRRRMEELLERAEISAPLQPAAPGGRELDEFAL